jgi:hypothetical protein
MRCLSCNTALTDKEAARKFDHCEEIKNPEDRYVGLCSYCLHDSELDEELPIDIIDGEIEDEIV